MIPVSSLICMGAGAVVGIAFPIALAWWLVKKYNVKPSTILIGAGVFIVFALGLESIGHMVVLKGPHGAAIMGNVWAFALYGGLMAGLFEETGRFVAMKWLLRKEPGSTLTGAGYGIGHGGMEMLMLFGVSMIANLVLSAIINSGQEAVLLGSAPAESAEQVKAQLAGLETLTPGTIVIGLWERLSALIAQLGLSLLVWSAVRRGGKWLWLYPAAIMLHALIDAIAVVLSKSVGHVYVEIVICAIAIAIGAMGWMLAKRNPDS